MPPGQKDEHSAPPARGPDRIGALPDDVLHHIAAAALTPLPAAMGSEGWTLPDGIDDNILSEILLRLPPQPSSLPRASAVCKRWHSLACDPGFCRRFRRHHHHNPPLLGFFDHPDEFEPTLDAPNRVPPGRFSLLLDDHFSYGSRNGLVLLFMSEQDEDHYSHILVWDPLTGDQYHIDFPPDVLNDNPIIGALLPRDDVHFRVVLVLAENEDVGRPRRALARVYSSQTSSWGDLMSVPVPPLLPPQASTRKYHRLFMDAIPAVLVGDSLYWQLGSSLLPGILEFNLERQRLDVIRAPVDMYPDELRDRYPCFSVIRAEDGGLGFLSLSGFTAQVWKRKTDNDGVASWVLGRTIQLDKLLSLDPHEHKRIFVRGYAEENNYVLLRTDIGLFILQLHSLQFRFFEDSETIDIPYYSCLPFESVFAAGT